MIDYAEIASGALTAIREAGTKVAIRRYTTAFNETTSESVPTLELDGEFDLAILPAKKANAIAGFQVGFDNSYAEKLRAGKVRALLIAASGAPFVPKQGDVAEFGDATWELLGCTSIDPSNAVPVVFKAEVVQL